MFPLSRCRNNTSNSPSDYNGNPEWNYDIGALNISTESEERANDNLWTNLSNWDGNVDLQVFGLYHYPTGLAHYPTASRLIYTWFR